MTNFQLNGKAVSVEAEPMARLLDILREHFELSGTREGCGEGECGACTVLMDDQPVLSCLIPLAQCEGSVIQTIESIAARPDARAFLDRFIAEGASQCGACTPGIIVTGWALGRGRGKLERDEIRGALAGNLCRCTGYESILSALEEGTES